MRKNIIAASLARVNAAVAKAAHTMELARGREATKVAAVNYSEITYVQASLVELIEASPLPLVDFKHECEGGNALETSKLIPSMLYTAYYSLANAWFRENDLFNADNGKPLFDANSLFGSKDEPGEYDGGDDELDITLTVGEALMFARSVFKYAVHISRIREKGMPYNWLVSMDTDEGTVHIVKPFKDWAVEKMQDLVNPASADRYKKLIAAEDDLNFLCNQLDSDGQYLEVMPDMTTVRENVKLWLHIPCDDGTYESRHDRIVSRTADRRFADVMDALNGLDLNDVLKAMKPWELIVASPKFAQELTEFKAGVDYQLWLEEKELAELTLMAEKLEEKERIEAARSGNNAIREALMKRLGLDQPVATLATPAAPAAPTVTVTVNNHAVTPNKRSAFNYTHR